MKSREAGDERSEIAKGGVYESDTKANHSHVSAAHREKDVTQRGEESRSERFPKGISHIIRNAKREVVVIYFFQRRIEADIVGDDTVRLSPTDCLFWFLAREVGVIFKINQVPLLSFARPLGEYSVRLARDAPAAASPK